MKTQSILMVLALAVPCILVAQTPDLSGTWQRDSNASQKWVLEQKDGKIHVKEMDGDKVEADFTCSLSGEECKAKEDGRQEKIMTYFNGPKLVEIRERNSTTEKRRLWVSDDGKTLTVETVPLTSGQKAETISFRKLDSKEHAQNGRGAEHCALCADKAGV